ncbi:hypothetical protein DNU06_17035 [Putridiphycobacter roseus]|uniref:DUF2383 domain-containing protein n=1 Tax=Putridiphycobacter roseus TaxID=2219161 RepID=A0A2W1MUZ8_9FLAO|nr:PA2169 family four-helix-bundle protein [Putridiphycobacter roseus]PZE15637.1 hypothetical protein DNU06_17035 [Putridiphycobacter roseus]
MDQELEKKLNAIVMICIDGNKGYATAAENISHTDLQTLFNRLSQQRKLFIEELKQDARSVGITLNDDGSVEGFFHRTWLSTKAFFSTQTLESVIESSLTGEEKAIEVYTETISEDIPSFIKERLINQLALIKVALNQLNNLK